MNRYEDSRACAALHTDANNLGESLIIGLGDYEGAIAAYEKALPHAANDSERFRAPQSTLPE